MGDKDDVVPRHVQLAHSFIPAGALNLFAIIGAKGGGGVIGFDLFTVL